MRADLETSLQARDLTIEELQSTNEELQSINEEQKATAEELETSREELQSTNEELITVNQEHRILIEDLRQTNADLQNLITASEIGTLFLDRTLRVRRYTPSLHGLINLMPGDLGRPLDHITHTLMEADLPGDAERVLATLEPLERELTSTNGNTYSVRFHPYRASDDRVDGVVVTFYDVSELKRLEEQLRRARTVAEEANRVKGAFLATLSHEFRTPLNSILGYAELLTLRGHTLDESQVRSVERLKSGIWHLSSMVDEILSYARLEAGHTVTNWSSVDARDIATDAGHMVEAAIAARQLAFDIELPAQAIELETDEDKVRQIVINLLGNSLKYTQHGSIRLALQQVNGCVEFAVRDTGIGIGPEHHEKIFERFWQVDGGLTRSAGGTGLGLTAARDLARLLGGDVRLESELGSGSTFTLWLPVSREATDA